MVQDKMNLIKRERLPTFTKIAYGLGSGLDVWGVWLYPAVAFAVFNIYLGVSPFLVGLALMIIRIYDAFADPIVGWISDNFRSSAGRRRPFILVAGVLSGLGLPLLFLVSPDWVDIKFLGVSVAFWYMVLSTLIYMPLISLFLIPFYSLGNELTPDYDERTSIMTFRSVMQKIFEAGNFYALKFTNLAWFLIPGTDQKNTLLGMQVFSGIIGIFMAIFAITMFFSLKERYYGAVVAKKQERISIRSSLYETLSCKPFRYLLGTNLAFVLSTGMVGALGYYATVYYVCGGDNRMGDNWNFIIGLTYMAGGFFGAPIFSFLASNIGKRKAMIFAAYIGMIAFGSTWLLYTPVHPWMQTLASGLIGFVSSAFWMLSSAIGPDIVDYDELSTGKRREGSFAACGSYIMKLANSLAYFGSGIILSLVGFDKGLDVQLPSAIQGIRLSLALLPIAGLALASVIISKFDLTRERCYEIREELEKRRGTV